MCIRDRADVVLGFLDVYVQGKPDGAERMQRRGNVDGKLRLSP